MIKSVKQMAAMAGIAITLFSCPSRAAESSELTAAKRFPWDNRPNKCFMSVDALALPMCKIQPDWVDMSSTVRALAELFAREDFDLIQRAEEEVGFSKEQFSTGEYKFEAWNIALESKFRWEPQYATATLSRWKMEKGTDGYAKLAEALVRVGEAWKARGGGYANTVTPEAWALFYQKLDQANDALDACSTRVKQMGPWHVLKLMVTYQNPNLKGGRLALLKAASDAWPQFVPIYSVPMSLVHPRWGGSFEAMDSIARIGTQQTKSELGAGMYSLLYAKLFAFDGHDTLMDTKADWTLMKQGFRDLESKPGRPAGLWFEFAKLACQVRDREEAGRLYKVYDARSTGNTATTDDACRQFANPL